jgi:integrase
MHLLPITDLCKGRKSATPEWALSDGQLPRRRDNVVKYGLKPVLTRLGIPTRFAGHHTFRHGLATELADRSTPIPMLQKQMRHADIRTTLKGICKRHPQRDAMEAVSIGTVPVMEQEQAANG